MLPGPCGYVGSRIHPCAGNHGLWRASEGHEGHRRGGHVHVTKDTLVTLALHVPLYAVLVFLFALGRMFWGWNTPWVGDFSLGVGLGVCFSCVVNRGNTAHTPTGYYFTGPLRQSYHIAGEYANSDGRLVVGDG